MNTVIFDQITIVKTKFTTGTQPLIAFYADNVNTCNYF